MIRPSFGCAAPPWSRGDVGACSHCRVCDSFRERSQLIYWTMVRPLDFLCLVADMFDDIPPSGVAATALLDDVFIFRFIHARGWSVCSTICYLPLSPLPLFRARRACQKAGHDAERTAVRQDERDG